MNSVVSFNIHPTSCSSLSLQSLAIITLCNALALSIDIKEQLNHSLIALSEVLCGGYPVLNSMQLVHGDVHVHGSNQPGKRSMQRTENAMKEKISSH